MLEKAGARDVVLPLQQGVQFTGEGAQFGGEGGNVRSDDVAFHAKAAAHMEVPSDVDRLSGHQQAGVSAHKARFVVPGVVGVVVCAWCGWVMGVCGELWSTDRDEKVGASVG